MEIEFEVTNMRPTTQWTANGNEMIALFDVEMFPFRLRGGRICRCKDGSTYVALPRRRECGWQITSPELYSAITETALDEWNEQYV